MNAETKAMNVEMKATPEITRAAERYLEQYGDPLVMNTYLKVTILVLAVVCFALAALTFKSQKALADMHPMIVRINDVGHAEAIDYRNFQYRPQEAENKYYLSRWAELYFSRNRFTVERDQTDSLYFLNSDVQRAVIDQERRDNIIQNYIKDSTLPYVDVEIKNVILDDLRQSPYSARIEFEKVYTNPADHTELKRERWTASVTYVFRENVKNNELGRQPPRPDHRALPGRPGVQLGTNRPSQRLFHVISCCQSGWLFLPVPVPCGAGERGPIDRQRRWRIASFLRRTCRLDIGLRLRRAFVANVPMTTLLGACLPLCIPSFTRSPLRGLSGARRHSVFCFAFSPQQANTALARDPDLRAPSGSRFLPKQVCKSTAQNAAQTSFGPLPESRPSALGAGPTR